MIRELRGESLFRFVFGYARQLHCGWSRICSIITGWNGSARLNERDASIYIHSLARHEVAQ
jgi:hypothetical protein